MSWKFFVAALFAAGFSIAGLATPASAQRASADEAAQLTPQAVRTLHNFARCVALESPNRTRDLLAMPRDSREFSGALLSLINRNRGCLRYGRLRGNQRFFLGRMAETLLVRDLGSRDLAGVVALDASRPPLQVAGEAEAMSICTVRAAPELVAALFRTDPASSREAAAIRALVPHLTACLAQGAEARFNRPYVRSMLALTAYRLADANGAWTRPAVASRVR